MTLYREEKKRIGCYRWVFAALILFRDYLSCESQITRIHIAELNGAADESRVVIFYFSLFWMMLFIISLNRQLFYLKEGRTYVSLMKKYEILPIKKRSWYWVKIRIMAETGLVLGVGKLGIYVLVLSIRDITAFDPMLGTKLLGFLIWWGIMMALHLVIDLYQNYRRG